MNKISQVSQAYIIGFREWRLGQGVGIYTKATDRAKRDATTALPFANVSPPKHVVSIRGTEGAQKGAHAF